MSENTTLTEGSFGERRTVRALTEALQVVEEADDLYLVASGSGSTYTVDLRGEPVCECPDFQHRESVTACKHIRRCYVATGRVAIPAELDVDAMDEMLVRRLESGDARMVATDGDGRRREVRPDGGEVLGPESDEERAHAASESLSATERADALGLSHVGDCSDEEPVDEKLRCWRCYYLDSVADE